MQVSVSKVSHGSSRLAMEHQALPRPLRPLNEIREETSILVSQQPPIVGQVDVSAANLAAGQEPNPPVEPASRASEPASASQVNASSASQMQGPNAASSTQGVLASGPTPEVLEVIL